LTVAQRIILSYKCEQNQNNESNQQQKNSTGVSLGVGSLLKLGIVTPEDCGLLWALPVLREGQGGADVSS